MREFNDIIRLLLPILIIQLGLQIYSLVNLSKAKKVRFDNKKIWVVIIIIGGIFGPVIYLLGKGADE